MIRKLNSTPAAYEVHDHRDDREKNQQVNEKAADVEDQEASEPKNQENHCEYKKHADLLSVVRGSRLFAQIPLPLRETNVVDRCFHRSNFESIKS